MNAALRHRDVWLARLSDSDRDALIARLAAVDAQVFERSAPDTFHNLFELVPGLDVAVREYVVGHQVVGFCVVRVAGVDVGGRQYRVLRTAAAMTRPCRGAEVLGLSLRLALRERLKHPFLRVVGFEQMTHPWSYAQVAGFVRTVAPRYSRPTQDGVRSLAIGLADHFGLRREDPVNQPFVCTPGYRTRQSDDERGRWAESNNPHVRFFHRLNARYDEGRSLFAVVSVTWTDVVVGLGRYLALRITNALERLGLHTRQPGAARRPVFGPRGELYD